MIEQEYLVVMDFSTRNLLIIELTEEEEFESLQYEDFSEFVETIEEKYGFNFEYSQWMLTEFPNKELKTLVFKNGKEVGQGRVDDFIYKI